MAAANSRQNDFRPSRIPLQNFSILWDRPNQTFDAIKVYWSRLFRPPPPPVQPFLRWGNKQAISGQITMGSRFLDLYQTRLDVGDESEWYFTHPLGRGGFGAVALFSRTNQQSQQLIDQVVAKTTMARKRDAVEDDRIELSKEAALMGQTNDLDEDGMLRLRNYKFYRNGLQWKFYFEYCPYGDLERLRIRYKAYGRYLPELFLWHLFYWLAHTAHQYTEYNDWLHVETDHWGATVTEGFLLHSDIKPANILLGPPDPDTSGPISLYPIPRIADLGLAEIQSLRNRNNWAAGLKKGTPGWYPPEVRFDVMNTVSDFYPFGHRMYGDEQHRFRKAGHKISSRANLWAIGAVMYSMLTLNEPEILEDIVRNVLNENSPMPEPDRSIIDDQDFQIPSGQYYSMDLRDLIKDCLRLRPQDRPSEHDVKEAAYPGYTRFLNTLINQGRGRDLQTAVDTLPEYRVYYRANEIDTATQGNYRFVHPDLANPSWFGARFIRDFPWLLPEWGRLWPETMPEYVHPPSEWPDEFRNALRHARREHSARRRAARRQRQASRVPLPPSSSPPPSTQAQAQARGSRDDTSRPGGVLLVGSHGGVPAAVSGSGDVQMGGVTGPVRTAQGRFRNRNAPYDQGRRNRW